MFVLAQIQGLGFEGPLGGVISHSPSLGGASGGSAGLGAQLTGCPPSFAEKNCSYFRHFNPGETSEIFEVTTQKGEWVGESREGQEESPQTRLLNHEVIWPKSPVFAACEEQRLSLTLCALRAQPRWPATRREPERRRFLEGPAVIFPPGPGEAGVTGKWNRTPAPDAGLQGGSEPAGS